MLPTVGSASAALRTYAHAASAQPADARPRHVDRDAPRRDASASAGNATPVPDEATLEAEARATVRALLDALRLRVLQALVELGLSAPAAEAAATAAAAKLAQAIGGDGQHAAQLVHAILERLHPADDTPKEADTAALLHLVAKGLDILIDHESGAATVAADALVLQPTHAVPAPVHQTHLVDITDGRAHRSDAVLHVLAAVQTAAREEGERAVPADGMRAAEIGRPAGPGHAARVIVAPSAFAAIVERRISAALQAPYGGRAPDAIRDVAATVSRAVAQAINGPAVPCRVSVVEAAESLARLEPAANAPRRADGPVTFKADRISVRIAPADGSVTVRIGSVSSVFSPASLAPAVSKPAPLPGLDTLPLPGLARAAHPVLVPPPDAARALPFVPPSFDDVVLDQVSPAVSHAARKAEDPARTFTTAGDAKHAADIASHMDAETVRLIEAAVARNATVLRGLLMGAGGERPAVTKLTLDIGASVAPVALPVAPPPPAGKFGLPKPPSPQGEDGPVHDNGHEDAASNRVPVLPPFYAVEGKPAGNRERKQRPSPPKPRAGRQTMLAAPEDATEDAFTREMPAGFEGFVFASVKLDA